MTDPNSPATSATGSEAGEITRYTFRMLGYAEVEMMKDSNGRWTLAADHLAARAQDRERIAELTKVADQHAKLCLAELGGDGVWPCGCHIEIVDSYGRQRLLSEADGEIHQSCDHHAEKDAEIAELQREIERLTEERDAALRAVKQERVYPKAICYEHGNLMEPTARLAYECGCSVAQQEADATLGANVRRLVDTLRDVSFVQSEPAYGPYLIDVGNGQPWIKADTIDAAVASAVERLAKGEE